MVAEKSRDHTHVEQPGTNASDDGTSTEPSHDAGTDEDSGQSYEQSGGRLHYKYHLT